MEYSRELDEEGLKVGIEYAKTLKSKGRSLALWATGKLSATTGGIYGTYKYFNRNKDEEVSNTKLDKEFEQRFGDNDVDQENDLKKENQIKTSLNTKIDKPELEIENVQLSDILETGNPSSSQSASSNQLLGENNSFLDRIINKMSFKDSKLSDNSQTKYLLGIIIFTGVVYSTYKFFNKRSFSNTYKSPHKSTKKSPFKVDSFLTKTLKKLNLIESSPVKKSPLKSPKTPKKDSIFKKTLKNLKLVKESPK